MVVRLAGFLFFLAAVEVYTESRKEGKRAGE
jgi:hypothetical protein